MFTREHLLCKTTSLLRVRHLGIVGCTGVKSPDFFLRQKMSKRTAYLRGGCQAAGQCHQSLWWMGTFAEQQSLITVYRLQTKANKLLPIAANKTKFAVSVFRLQQTNGTCRLLLVQFSV
jgi:hypothetical protein